MTCLRSALVRRKEEEKKRRERESRQRKIGTERGAFGLQDFTEQVPFSCLETNSLLDNPNNNTAQNL